MKKIVGNILKWFVLPLVSLFLILNVVLYYNQDLITFFPQKLSRDYSFNFNREFKEDFFVTSAGDSLNYIIFKTQGNREGMVFHTHGNAGNIRTSVGPYRYFLDNGYDYITWDYASFGKSTGKLKPETFLNNASELYDHIAKEYEKEKVILHGHSLGTSVTSYLASNNEVNQVVLLAPFYNVVEMAKMRFPVFDWMITFPLMTDDFLRKTDEDVVIIHGTDDETVPYKQGERLSKVREGIDFVTIPEYGHNDISNRLEYKEMMDQILLKLKND
jgi:alpha-beta hydrolase superfamily lysophospholipase